MLFRSKKAQSTQRREQENRQADSSQTTSDSEPIKSLGILNPEEAKEYQKVRNRVITILRTELIQSRMKEWIDELKRSSIIEVKL